MDVSTYDIVLLMFVILTWALTYIEVVRIRRTVDKVNENVEGIRKQNVPLIRAVRHYIDAD